MGDIKGMLLATSSPFTVTSQCKGLMPLNPSSMEGNSRMDPLPSEGRGTISKTEAWGERRAVSGELGRNGQSVLLVCGAGGLSVSEYRLQ